MKCGLTYQETLDTAQRYVKGNVMEALKDFIRDKLLIISYNEYEGMEESLPLQELYRLEGIVEGIISSMEQSRD
jgi:hypothetical protein